MQVGKKTGNYSGFTIVELLIVIVVIGILATLVIVTYSNTQANSQAVKIRADLSRLSTAIQAARQSEAKVLGAITGSYYSASSCASLAAGTDLATLSRSNGCWVRYLQTLDIISTASGMNIRNMVDPWDRPYFIDENEGESGGCGMDLVSVYSLPANGAARNATFDTNVRRIGLTGCTI